MTSPDHLADVRFEQGALSARRSGAALRDARERRRTYSRRREGVVRRRVSAGSDDDRRDRRYDAASRPRRRSKNISADGVRPGPGPRSSRRRFRPTRPARRTCPRRAASNPPCSWKRRFRSLRADPAWAQLQLANAALTGGFYSSLLYHDLREIHGYAYSVGSHVQAGRVRRRSTSTMRAMPSTSFRRRPR